MGDTIAGPAVGGVSRAELGVPTDETMGLWVESSRMIWASLPTITYRFTRFSNSRILPGQEYSMMRPTANSLNGGGCFPYVSLYLVRKKSRKTGTSSRRSRNGGMWMLTTLSR